MTVKNTSSKIIAFGNETLLPGETTALDKTWETNPVVKMYLERGMLQRVEETTSTVPNTVAESDTKPGDETNKEPEVKEPEIKESKSKK